MEPAIGWYQKWCRGQDGNRQVWAYGLLVRMSSCDVIYPSVNHLTAREASREEGGSGRCEARGENGHHSILHFHLLQADQSQRLKGKSRSPGGLPQEADGWEGSGLGAPSHRAFSALPAPWLLLLPEAKIKS